MFEQEIVIDGRAHLLGRLASIVAKELLNGQHVCVVRCEQITVSGSLMRNKMKFTRYLNKRHSTNPARGGPHHFKAPARMFWKCVRGMVPHKTARGAAAMARLVCFEGMPHPYDKKKKMCVPFALKALRIKPNRRYTVLERLADEFGWKHSDLVRRLEAKRKTEADAFYEKKKATAVAYSKATKAANLSAGLVSQLESFGH